MKRYLIASVSLVALLVGGACAAVPALGLNVASASANAERLPKAALAFKVFREKRTPAQQPTPAEMDALQNIQGSWHDPQWQRLYSFIGGPLLSQARRIPIPGLDFVLVPGPRGIAIVRIADGLVQVNSQTYDKAMVGGLGGFSRSCSDWAPNDMDCAAPDGGELIVNQLAPDGVRSAVINGKHIPIVDNLLAARVGPLSLQNLMIAGLDANQAAWTALVHRRAAAERKAQAEKRAAAKRHTAAQKKKQAFAG